MWPLNIDSNNFDISAIYWEKRESFSFLAPLCIYVCVYRRHHHLSKLSTGGRWATDPQ